MACFGDGVGPTPYAIDAAMACSGMDVASTASGATRTPSPRRTTQIRERWRFVSVAAVPRRCPSLAGVASLAWRLHAIEQAP